MAEQVALARENLLGIPTEVVAERGRANLPAIVRRLKGEGGSVGSYDIVYLISHGALLAAGPVLYLEDAEGKATAVQGADFVDALTELDNLPTLVVLAACQSAGSESSSMYASALALGPKLAAAGVPAVLAMHGNVTADTVELFMPAFLRALAGNGVAARGGLAGPAGCRGREPAGLVGSGALYQAAERPGLVRGRLPRGQVAQMADVPAGYRRPVLHTDHRTPAERRVLDLTSTCGVPDCRALAGAGLGAQPIRPDQGSPVSGGESGRSVPANRAGKIHVRVHSRVRSPACRSTSDSSVNELISAMGKAAREANENDPYKLLAGLPFPVYFTTSWTNLLEDALKEAGRPARVKSFDWNKDRPESRPLAVTADDPDNPVVFRLFGNFDDIDSIVLTEDDYFQYLTHWTLSRKFLSGLSSTLTNANLLLLGFGLDDWDFRVLFRSIQTMEGSVNNYRLAHVAVQLNPESETFEPEVVQQYLEDYLGRSNYSIHWGTSAEFLKDLSERWQLYPG